MLSSFLGRWRWPSRPQYNALEEALSEDEIDIEGEKEGSQIQLVRNKIRPWYRRPVFPLAGLVLLGVLFAGLGLGYILQGFGHQASNRESTDDYTCTESKISLRREWRTLNKIEQREYVQAVKCMLGRPSQTRPTGFLYDDFAYVRAQPGMHSRSHILNTLCLLSKIFEAYCVYTANGVASFFPWHRYFLHVYEKQLREVCGYTGNLT